MPKFKKQYEHNNEKINVSVESHFDKEKSINFDKWYIVTTTCLQEKKVFTDQVLPIGLKDCIETHHRLAKMYIDLEEKNSEKNAESILLELGFIPD